MLDMLSRYFHICFCLMKYRNAYHTSEARNLSSQGEISELDILASLFLTI